LHGEDDLAINDVVAELFTRLGDPTNADMNTARFEGNIAFDELQAAASAMPFLAERRLVIVRGAGKAFSAGGPREQFIGLLDAAPPSTALVLIEPTLKDNHWLMKWAQGAGERAFVKAFALPQGGAMTAWVQKQVDEAGGEIEPAAAALLGDLIGSDTRAAAQEIEKLLAYVNYSRPITRQDVSELAVQIAEGGDFFALIDALSAGAGKPAMAALHKLLAERDLISLFFGIVAHYRALIQAWEVNHNGGSVADLKRAIGTNSDFRAKKLMNQARRFSRESLEAIYRRLMQYDLEIKTGEIDTDLALDTFVAALTAQAA
jgi:DNA polymerase-3 subunit delta